jgi:hypothetical protein
VAVKREVQSCISDYDVDASGTLNWLEFAKMFTENFGTFHIAASEALKTQLAARIVAETARKRLRMPPVSPCK